MLLPSLVVCFIVGIVGADMLYEELSGGATFLGCNMRFPCVRFLSEGRAHILFLSSAGFRPFGRGFVG